MLCFKYRFIIIVRANSSILSNAFIDKLKSVSVYHTPISALLLKFPLSFKGTPYITTLSNQICNFMVYVKAIQFPFLNNQMNGSTKLSVT